ncbi:hypothetical protein HPB51_027806 [Rhipicephalus microplus]|uniref:Uncharacterized protein n=1 Tax=Rhipicephalus microplus TaxID=6941 RepID=A0A9J6CZE8_RHIMP|nr:hypothetical protein HPB51_027806 [Rhipicephalus microplus]
MVGGPQRHFEMMTSSGGRDPSGKTEAAGKNLQFLCVVGFRRGALASSREVVRGTRRTSIGGERHLLEDVRALLKLPDVRGRECLRRWRRLYLQQWEHCPSALTCLRGVRAVAQLVLHRCSHHVSAMIHPSFPADVASRRRPVKFRRRLVMATLRIDPSIVEIAVIVRYPAAKEAFFCENGLLPAPSLRQAVRLQAAETTMWRPPTSEYWGICEDLCFNPAKRILPGTTVCSDEWAANHCIPRLVDANETPLNLDWHTMYHSVNFVDPTTGANTQRIESEWQNAKRRLVRNSNKTTILLMPSHLAWLWWKSINARPKDTATLYKHEDERTWVIVEAAQIAREQVSCISKPYVCLSEKELRFLEGFGVRK